MLQTRLPHRLRQAANCGEAAHVGTWGTNELPCHCDFLLASLDHHNPTVTIPSSSHSIVVLLQQKSNYGTEIALSVCSS
jgi:hypothetical protein